MVMDKNKKYLKKWKIFFAFLGLANFIFVILPIILALYYQLYVRNTVDGDPAQAAGLGYGLLIAALAFAGVFVVLANILLISFFLKRHKPEKPGMVAGQIIIAMSASLFLFAGLGMLIANLI